MAACGLLTSLPARTAGSWRWPSTRPAGPAEQGEVPIGAVLVLGGEVVASRGNERERRNDPTAHAEMLVAPRRRGHRRRLAAYPRPPST